jgi:RNA polymerase sigma factor (sigma-70 family)
MTTIEAIFHEQRSPLLRRLQRMVGDPETAADLCQETFVRAWRKAPRDVSAEHQRGWLHRTASNLALDELRRRKLRNHVLLDESRDGDPRAIDHDDRLHAREAMARLLPHERMVLLLRFEAGLSHREIGALLDVGEEAARKRVERARASFATALRSDATREDAPLVLFLRGEDDDAPYHRWIERAGGRMRAIDHRDLEREIVRADAIVLGGSHRDIHPALYGDAPRFGVPDGGVSGDRADLRALHLALAQDVPMVGVCRGHQLLNIALGGSLWQDLESDGAGGDHRDGGHAINTGEHSLSRTIIGRRAEVASEHHQGIRRLGRGVRVTSASPDGIAEIIEIPQRRFALGLQWHPERSDIGDAGDRIADALVHSARTRRAALSRTTATRR